MPYTTLKHRNFVSEPMGEKLVTDLPGIGNALGRTLSEEGYAKAYHVLGQFLMFNKDRERFERWLAGICGANSKQAGDCYTCLKTWCDSFM